MASDDPRPGGEPPEARKPPASSAARPDRTPASKRAGKAEPNPLILLGAASEMGLLVAGATVLGWWLDGQWGTRPWLTVVGVVFGMVGGMYNLWRVSRKFF